LDELRAVHEAHPDLSNFCPFPDQIERKTVAPKHDPLSDLMQDASTLPAPESMTSLRNAVLATADTAVWRDTYMDSDFGETLHAAFGCFEVLGIQTPLGAKDMRGFVIYQKPGFYYPMHHHPAEELYLVVAGEGEFHQEGEPSKVLSPGDTAFHKSNVPHALTTHDKPIVAYVLWRGELTTKPVWTYPEQLV
jgi:quercetin dioxygenase-like cupin family protein